MFSYTLQGLQNLRSRNNHIQNITKNKIYHNHSLLFILLFFAVMRIEQEIKLDYKDVLFKPKRSTLTSRKEVDITRTFTFYNSKQKRTWVPIIAANMDTIGTIEMAKVLYEYGMITCLHKFYSLDDIVKIHTEDFFQNCAITTGILEHDIEKLDSIMNACPSVRFICLDVANGYTQRFISTVASVRKKYPHVTIIAGNVVSQEITEELILKWADIIKVGIWPGSVCTTRLQTWVGYPQLSAVIECGDAAHGIGGKIVADGWCVVPGDVAKAFGWWADFVMLGGMLAGHDQCPGEVIEENGKKYKEYYGMSSEVAMKKHYGWVEKHRSSEWKRVLVPYKWDIRDTLQSILGWVRSTCTYVGAKRLKDLPKCTTFIRCLVDSNEVWGRNR